MQIEKIILNNLVFEEDFLRKTIPFLKEEYFLDPIDHTIFKHIKSFVDKYNTTPSKDALIISVTNDNKVLETQFETICETISSFDKKTDTSIDWLVDETEKFCKNKAIYNAVSKSIRIIQDKEKDLSVDSIPDLLQEALSVGFDLSVGHDYLEDADKRFEFYHTEEEKLPFDLDVLNKITKGGLSKKTLNLFMALPGVGKSLTMCHMAANNLMNNKNVLYITLEMSQEKIAERIDLNLMNLMNVSEVEKNVFDTRIGRIRAKTTGKLIIKEYPTGAAHVGHFRALLKELKIKKNFIPDVIYIDYLNICASSRFKDNSNSYLYVKSIAEECRGLAVQFNVPLISATQTNRSGFGDSDVDLNNTSESFGVPATADLFIALYTDDDLNALGQIMGKQLKNRYNDLNFHKKFFLGVDKSLMKLYDLNDSPLPEVRDDEPRRARVEQDSYEL